MRAFVPLLLSTLCAACAVGPDYKGPPNAASTALQRGSFQRLGDIPTSADAPLAQWWKALGDPLLDGLETHALNDNTDMALAYARLREARAGLKLEKANGMPNGSASALYAYARLPPINLGSSGSGGASGSSSAASSGSGDATRLNLYSVGFDATWEIDLFGGHRRSVEAAGAQADGAAANLADTQVTLTAEVAQAYVNLRDRQHRIALNGKAVAQQERMLALTRQRRERGTASQLEVDRLQGQLDGTRADAVPLNAEAEGFLDQLAVLTGQEPGAVDTAVGKGNSASGNNVLLPPATVAVADPAAMLQRRPDIRAAERALAARTANIGVQKAARFPKLTLLGLIGIGGTHPSDLTHLDNIATIGAPMLSWSFLDFGRGEARVNQAEAQRDQAEIQYRAAVLGALRDAEDALSRYRYRRVSVATLARAKASADSAATLTQQRYEAGTVSLIDLLDAQRQQIAAEQNLSVAEAGLTGDFISLQKALGLGWSDAADAANATKAAKARVP